MYIDDFAYDVRGHDNDMPPPYQGWIGRWMEELEVNLISEALGVIIEVYDSVAEYRGTGDYRFDQDRMFRNARLNATYLPTAETKNTDDYRQDKMTVFKLLSSLALKDGKSVADATPQDKLSPNAVHWYWARPQRPAGLPGPSSQSGNVEWRAFCRPKKPAPAAGANRQSSKASFKDVPGPNSAPNPVPSDQRQRQEGDSAAAAAALRRAGQELGRIAPPPAPPPASSSRPNTADSRPRNPPGPNLPKWKGSSPSAAPPKAPAAPPKVPAARPAAAGNKVVSLSRASALVSPPAKKL